MTNEERDIQRKLKVLQHAEKIGNAPVFWDWEIQLLQMA
ncbi:hypothetical protein DSM110277_01470 [Sulfitobacter pontiacus]|uniref:Uncharacterized protein n=1 Tax=Sulfitobacter pontiacus TaxID=60137 RepID=A0AAX3A9Y3_9RHOB|nr:hypothetical protein DSM110277_01470 [Sulfitobacter pontiacus]